MKTYEYERIRIQFTRGFTRNRLPEDYFEIVQREAAKGWRFVQTFSPDVAGYGVAEWVDLIFERERA